MDDQLIVHCGGWEASKADVQAVPVPEETDSYVPVPYSRFIEEVELHVPRFGLQIADESFALAREGNQMFAVLTCKSPQLNGDFALAIGVRNSYDRSLSVGLVAGTRVFCCDNLAFSGEASMARKHTANVFRDLPDLIYRMLSSVSSMQERTRHEIVQMKDRMLAVNEAEHLLIEGVKASVVPVSKLPQVIDAWEKPEHEEFRPRNAWSLFNAFSEVQKTRSARAQMEDTLRLSHLFRRELQLSA